jgi:DNA topoisomerase-2
MGLQIAKKYDDLKQLRYGSIMIMSDQDTDGSHIKGLVINFIHHFWPSLFRINGFIKQFITPLLKATKGTQVIPFYTMGDFKAWADQQ